jgi:hypothetical protein
LVPVLGRVVIGFVPVLGRVVTGLVVDVGWDAKAKLLGRVSSDESESVIKKERLFFDLVILLLFP